MDSSFTNKETWVLRISFSLYIHILLLFSEGPMSPNLALSLGWPWVSASPASTTLAQAFTIPIGLGSTEHGAQDFVYAKQAANKSTTSSAF